MPICKKCNNHFPNSIKINGKRRNLQNRKFCLECSPFGKHNTRKTLDKTYKCNDCGTTNIDDFYDSSHYKLCKKCLNKRSIENQQKRKKKALELKGNKCCICGYDKCDSALEFHHVDPNEKDSNIRFSTNGWEKIKKELEKCICVCANCHREIHSGLYDEI